MPPSLKFSTLMSTPTQSRLGSSLRTQTTEDRPRTNYRSYLIQPLRDDDLAVSHLSLLD